MRRSLFALAVALVALAGFAGATVFADADAEPLQFQQVNLNISCSNGDVSNVSIVPWNVRASRGAAQQVRWRLLPASDVDSATIRPKETSTWPFATTAPITVTSGGNRTVDSGAISAANGAYFYDVLVNCGNGEHVIDPRMDIDP